ncbi:MAG: hypothetical protein ACTHU0_30425 [Kofleriaceae bacterium]
MRALCCFLAVVLATGCNLVFSIESAPADASHVDGAEHDAPPGHGPVYIAPGDYDGDGMENDVDPCPHIIGNGGGDDDGDGVGNACDPNANAGQPDCIALFDFFDDQRPLERDRWSGPGWENGTCYLGEAALCSPPSTTNSLLRYRGRIDAAHVEVKLAVTGGNELDLNAVEIVTGLDDVPVEQVSGQACGVLSDSPGQAFLVVRDYNDGMTNGASARGTQIFHYVQSLFTLSWTPSSVCAVTITDGTLRDLLSVQVPPRHGGPFIGMRLQSTSIALRHIIGYSAICPPALR